MSECSSSCGGTHSECGPLDPYYLPLLRRPSPRCRTARARLMPSDTLTPARVVASNRVGNNTGQDPAAGDVAKSTPLRAHLQPRARPAKQAAARTDASALQPVNLNAQFDHLKTRMTSASQPCPLQADDGASEQKSQADRVKLAEMLKDALAQMRPDTAARDSQPPACGLWLWCGVASCEDGTE